MKTGLIVMALVLALSVPAYARAEDMAMAVSHLFSEIDLSSFANSLGPRHLPSGTTLKDLGWVPRALSGQSVTYMARDGGWSYKIGLIQTDRDHLVICFTDKGLREAQYFSSRLERLHPVRKDDGQLRYVADVFRSSEPCPETHAASSVRPDNN
jgi:hypothetical protein